MSVCLSLAPEPMTLRTALPLVILFAVAPIWPAATPSWKDKPLSQWDAEDAKQLLADSPWVKHSQPHWLPDLSPFQREEGGNLNEGVGKGVGLAGTGLLGSRREAAAIKRAHTKPEPAPVIVRWESALPVRVAEHMTGDIGAPALKGDDYAIAVYDIPTPKQGNLAGLLKGAAFLRRYQKKEIKPSHVEILRNDDDDETATVVYLFPRSVEITKRDGGIEFAAQIGRLWVSQYFYTGDMQFRGEPQLLMPSTGLH
jgi:hypothetical protein